MIVVRAESSVTLRTFTLTRFISGLQTVPTKYMKTFGQNGIFTFDFTRWTGQRLFVFTNFFHENNVGGSGRFYFLHAFHFATQLSDFFLRNTKKERRVSLMIFITYQRCIKKFFRKKQHTFVCLPAS